MYQYGFMNDKESGFIFWCVIADSFKATHLPFPLCLTQGRRVLLRKPGCSFFWLRWKSQILQVPSTVPNLLLTPSSNHNKSPEPVSSSDSLKLFWICLWRLPCSLPQSLLYKPQTVSCFWPVSPVAAFKTNLNVWLFLQGMQKFIKGEKNNMGIYFVLSGL